MCDTDDCCKKFAKFMLVVINLFFLLLGMLMLAFGIAMVAAPDKVASSVKETGADLSILGDANSIIKAAGIFMIVLGGVVTLIGAFGFFGACCENKCLLITYLIVVIIVLLAEVALIIFAAVFPASLKTYIQEQMERTLIKDFTQDVRVYPNVTFGSTYPFGYSWAATQLGAKCCGVYNSSDYARLPIENRTVVLPSGARLEDAKVPISCCKLVAGRKFPDDIKNSTDFENLDDCLRRGTMGTSVNTQNCYDSIDGMIMQASRIAIGIAAAIVGFEIIIIILGIILCCAITRSKSLSV
jgi:tetraspanin-18